MDVDQCKIRCVCVGGECTLFGSVLIKYTNSMCCIWMGIIQEDLFFKKVGEKNVGVIYAYLSCEPFKILIK